MSQRLLEMGCYEISLGDTIGTGAAGTTHRLLDTVLKSIPADKVAVHFHDTYGQVPYRLPFTVLFYCALAISSVAFSCVVYSLLQMLYELMDIACIYRVN